MKLVTKTDGMIALIRLQEVSDTRSLEQILENHRIWNHKVMFPVHVAAIKLPDCGTCSVIWDCADGYEHVSVSPQKSLNKKMELGNLAFMRVSGLLLCGLSAD